MVDENWAQLAEELQSLLNLEAPPLAITFSLEVPVGVSRYAGRGPKPAQDGRTGKVSAGCVFWMKATDRTFTTMSILSRVRTGMPRDEVTCAIPSGRLRELLKKLRDTCAADNAVAQYAATDSLRFAEKC